MDTWEKLLIGAIGLLVVLWISPGIKPMLARGREAPKDWAGVLIPIALVVAFVIFLGLTLQ